MDDEGFDVDDEGFDVDDDRFDVDNEGFDEDDDGLDVRMTIDLMRMTRGWVWMAMGLTTMRVLMRMTTGLM